MKMEIHGFTYVHVCMLSVYFYPYSCSPAEMGDVGKVREGRKESSLIKDDVWWAQVTSALFSILSTTHSTLISLPNFREN